MSCMRRTSPAVARYCDLASFLLKPLKAVTKKTTKRILIVAFFLGKDRYLAAEQPDLEFGQFIDDLGTVGGNLRSFSRGAKDLNIA